jgi:DNA-binding LytR/AlgR family response regulator
MAATILIVEDEPIIAADLQDRIEDLGYRVQEVVDRGEDAIRLLEDQRPDLILMDVQLAGQLDGVDAALTIHERWGTPLIFLTSNSDSPTFKRARNARPRAFLSKPFRGRDLAHAIELALAEDIAPAPRAQKPVAETELPEGESAMILNDRLFIRVKDRLTRLFLSDILWIEADDYYCKVQTAERDYLVTKTLKKFVALLPPDAPFMRCHRSYVVNLRKVTEIGEIYLFVGEKTVPVSRSRRAELLNRLKNL